MSEEQKPDPLNAPPEEWTEDLSEVEQESLRELIQSTVDVDKEDEE